MIIREAKIQKFGKLENEQYQFAPGINVIYGPNESGKSTLMHFLKAMMFGLEKSRARKTLDTYKKYEPWDAPAYFSGSMLFETGQQQFLLERNFYHKERRARLVNIRDGEELSVEYGDLDMLLGNVSAGAYENTFCIGQEQMLPGSELGVLLEDERSNLAQTGSSEFPLSKALQSLDQKRKNAEKKRKVLEQQRLSDIHQLEVKQQMLERDVSALKEQQETQRGTSGDREAQIQAAAKPLLAKYKEICQQEQRAEEYMDQMRQDREDSEVAESPKAKKAFSPLVEIGLAGLLLVNLVRGQRMMSHTLSMILNVICVLLLVGGLIFPYMDVKKKNRMSDDTTAWEEKAERAARRLSEIRQKKAELEQQLQNLKEEKQRIQMQKARQEGSEDQIFSQIQEKEVEMANLTEQIQELQFQTAEEKAQEQDVAALELASDTLQRLARQMSKSLEQGLNREMSEILAQITGERHTTLEMTAEHGLLLGDQGQKCVSGKSTDRFRSGLSGAQTINRVPQAYSYGTTQQAYFAYRMAAGKLLAKEEPLPFLLDEAFCSYDRERLRQVLCWLAEQENQIFLFTCRETEAELLREEGIPFSEIVL